MDYGINKYKFIFSDGGVFSNGYNFIFNYSQISFNQPLKYWTLIDNSSSFLNG